MAAVYSNASNQVAALKELYPSDGDFMKDLVYAKNPLLALIPKNESPSGFAGKYIPVPVVYATGQGRSHTFANAQAQQTAVGDISFFVYRISDYQLVTITNELLEATANDAGAFVEQAKLNMDTGFRNISNNLAHDLYASGTGSRGQISSAGMTTSGSTTACSWVLSNPAAIVNFEVNMLLVASATDGGVPSASTVLITSINRATGAIGGTSSNAHSSDLSAEWAAAGYLTISGDVPAAGASGTGSYLAVSGLAAWFPSSAPASNDSFWGVNRSVDSTRLAGIRFDGSGETIEEALIDGAALVAREGGMPDMCFMGFASYAALVKSLGAKVQYVEVKHDEVDVGFTGITIHAAYGQITVVPDRNCPPQTAYLLSMDTLKLRSLGKAPHVLTYGLEGLEGVRVGAADALEIRIGYYANLICSAPGWNAVVSLSQ